MVNAHSYAPTPDGFYKVGDRFAKVYWEKIGEAGRQRLGNAVNEARDSRGAFQEFRKGRMFWAGEADTIYVIYRGYSVGVNCLTFNSAVSSCTPQCLAKAIPYS